MPCTTDSQRIARKCANESNVWHHFSVDCRRRHFDVLQCSADDVCKEFTSVQGDYTVVVLLRKTMTFEWIFKERCGWAAGICPDLAEPLGSCEIFQNQPKNVSAARSTEAGHSSSQKRAAHHAGSCQKVWSESVHALKLVPSEFCRSIL